VDTETMAVREVCCCCCRLIVMHRLSILTSADDRLTDGRPKSTRITAAPNTGPDQLQAEAHMGVPKCIWDARPSQPRPACLSELRRPCPLMMRVRPRLQQI
jgi:hypothetical protein